MFWRSNVALPLLLFACKGGDGAYDGLEKDPCRPGARRVGVSACVAPAAVRGDDGATIWDDVDRIVVRGDCADEGGCDLASPVALQFVQRSSDGLGPGIEVRITFDRPLPEDDSLRYLLTLGPAPPRKSRARDALIFGPDAVSYRKGTAIAQPVAAPELPYRATLDDTRTMLVAWVARAIMPANHAALLGIVVERRDGEGWKPAFLAGEIARVCWDPADRRHDPCGVGD